MICAYVHPQATKLLHAIEEMPTIKRNAVKALILAAVGVALSIYYVGVYSLPKLEYNKVCLQLAARSVKLLGCSSPVTEASVRVDNNVTVLVLLLSCGLLVLMADIIERLCPAGASIHVLDSSYALDRSAQPES